MMPNPASTGTPDDRIAAALDYIALVIEASQGDDFRTLQNERMAEVRKLLTGETTREIQQQEALEANRGHFREAQSRWHARLFHRLAGCPICAHPERYR